MLRHERTRRVLCAEEGAIFLSDNTVNSKKVQLDSPIPVVGKKITHTHTGRQMHRQTHTQIHTQTDTHTHTDTQTDICELNNLLVA